MSLDAMSHWHGRHLLPRDPDGFWSLWLWLASPVAHSPGAHSRCDCAQLRTLGSVLAGSVKGCRDGGLKATDPQRSFNIASTRKPEKRGLPGLRVGMREEEKVLLNLDIRNDGLGMLLASGCCHWTYSALQTSSELCQPTPAGNVTWGSRYKYIDSHGVGVGITKNVWWWC